MADAFNPACQDTQIVANLKRQRAAREGLSIEQIEALNNNRIDRDLSGPGQKTPSFMAGMNGPNP